MVWVLVCFLLPLFLATLVFLFPSRIDFLSVMAVVYFFLMTALSLLNVFGAHKVLPHVAWTWHFSNFTPWMTEWSFNATVQGGIMVCVLSVISFAVALFSLTYMRHEPRKYAFFAYLLMFFPAMSGILLSRNLLSLFFFWEWVGMVSWLFIGFWYEKPKASQACLKAFLINKFADLLLLVGIISVAFYFKTMDIDRLLEKEITFPFWVSGCLIMGAMAKSAQFPLHTWLPDAMVGPTPASALIHAATMVAAGVWLLLQLYPCLDANVWEFFKFLFGLTGILAGLSALVQTDLKRIVAYSTVSQLAIMMFLIGAQRPDLAFLHLVVHAFFKAGLFLGAGAIINKRHQEAKGADPQLLSGMLGIAVRLPHETFGFVLCAAALVGMPLTAGFISKELMVYHFLENDAFSMLLVFMTISILTICYTFRMMVTVFQNVQLKKYVESLLQIPFHYKFVIPIFLLSLLSLGFLVSPTGIGTTHIYTFWNISQPLMDIQVWVPTLAVWAVAGLFWMVMPGIKARYPLQIGIAEKILLNHFYIDLVVGGFIPRVVIFGTKWIQYIDLHVFDKLIRLVAVAVVVASHIVAWIDTYMVDGVVRLFYSVLQRLGRGVQQVQSGKVQQYMVYALSGILFVIAFLYFLFS